MKLLAVRFTVRRMMFAVAVAAVALGAVAACIGRRVHFLALASSHSAEACDGRIVPPSRRATMSEAELAAYYERRLAWEDYHSGLASKYARAARYPWIPVEPDPPEPE